MISGSLQIRLSGVTCAVLTLCFSQVLQHELHHIKKEVKMSKQAAAKARVEKGQLEAEVRICLSEKCAHIFLLKSESSS